MSTGDDATGGAAAAAPTPAAAGSSTAAAPAATSAAPEPIVWTEAELADLRNQNINELNATQVRWGG